MPALYQHSLRALIALWFLGSAAVLCVTAAASAIGFTLPMAMCALLMSILLLSLLGRFVSSVIFSVAAVGCLDYFFVEPTRSFRIGTLHDLVTLSVFLLTSITATNLIRNIRAYNAAQNIKAHQLDLAAYLAEAQRLSHTGSFGWDTSSDRLIWSEETFRIFDLEHDIAPSAEIVLSRTHPEDRDVVRSTFEGAAEDRSAIDFQHRLLLPSGSIKHVRVVARPTSNDGATVQFIGAVMDITDEISAYAELKRSEQHYKQLFDLVPIALWQLDASALKDMFADLRKAGVKDLQRYFEEHPDFLSACMKALTYQDANQHAVRLFGARDVSDFVGLRAGWGTKESTETFQRAMISRYEGATSFEEETKMTTLDGRVVDVIFTSARLGQIEHTTTSVTGAIDITEQVRAREQLQQLQAEVAHAARVSMLGELAASIAHEVNQPLGAISTTGAACLRWLDQADPNIDSVRSRIERMVDDARRASDIITRIRTMATKAPQNREYILMGDMIRDALFFLRQQIRSQGISVDHHATDALYYVLGDRTQLQQLVVNLFLNAIQATQRAGVVRGKISIRTVASDSDSISFIIEDNGPGISQENFVKVFDSFFTTKDNGMGLGLAICRSIVTSHGGTINVDNDSSLGGARFTVRIPRAPVKAQSNPF